MITVVDRAILLSGRNLEVIVYAVRVAQRDRARNGLPRSRDLDQLAAAVAQAAGGQPDSGEQVEVETDYISCREAAGILGCSERSVRRWAPGLGGQLVGGRWLVDRQAVVEHAAGQTRMEESS